MFSLNARTVLPTIQPATCKRPAWARGVQCAATTVVKRPGKTVGDFTYIPPRFVPEHCPQVEVPLLRYDAVASPSVDVVIAGAGPAGLAAAARVAQAGFDVAVVDPNPLVHWPNNYGVWSDEFEAMNLGDCFEIEWSKANVWLGEKQEKCVPMSC